MSDLQSPWPLRLIYLFVILIGIAMVPLLCVAYSGGCTAPERSRRVLIDTGYHRIEIKGHAWFACGRDDDFATEFEATTPQGRRISGAVCCGVLKSCTVRIDP